MVFGFLGTVISLERAVALRRGWGYLTPAGTIARVALLLAGRRKGSANSSSCSPAPSRSASSLSFVVSMRAHATASVATLLLSLSRVGVLLVAVGTLLVLGFGLWLVYLGDWGYSVGWVDAALGLLTATVVLGGLGGRRPKRARKLAVRLAGEGVPISPELRALFDDRATLAANYRSALVVFEPGAVRS